MERSQEYRLVFHDAAVAGVYDSGVAGKCCRLTVGLVLCLQVAGKNCLP